LFANHKIQRFSQISLNKQNGYLSFKIFFLINKPVKLKLKSEQNSNVGCIKLSYLNMPEKTEGGLEKLQACEAGRKSRKRPTLVVGKKPNGKSRIN
jgi:hypothetical protein